MCGIAGYNFEDKALMQKMLALIRHRGPDDSGTFTDRGVAGVTLGHQRLSIIDLSKNGHMPMTNVKGNLTITYNGEIYNHREIRKDLEKKGYQFKSNTDTEVILNAYDAYGVDCLKLFNGPFAFVIYDPAKKTFFGARDRIGIKPLYYHHENKKFIFCSEIKSMLLHDIPKKINLDSVNWFVSLRYIGGEGTIFQSIQRLMAGHYFIYDLKTDNLFIKKYWDLTYGIDKKPEAYFVQELRNQLTAAVKRRLMSDVPLGVYLSGGLDSSTIVALMSEMRDNIRTFSVGFGYGGEVDELKHAKLVAEHFNTDHTEFMVKSELMKNLPRLVWHHDEPLADPACLPAFLLSEQAKKHVTVIQAGEGSDEMFAGYEQNKFLLHRNKLKYVPKPVRSMGAKTVELVPEKVLNLFFAFASNIGKQGRKRFCNYVKHIDNKAQAYSEIMGIFNNKERKEILTPGVLSKVKLFDHAKRINEIFYNDKNPYLNQILRYEVKEPLPENLLMKADKTTMAFAIECRVPFLDHKVAEFAATIPPSLKLHGLRDEKYVLKQAVKDIVPKQIIKRKKHRFYVPIDYWLQKEDVQSLVDSLLDKQTVEKQGYFNYTAIEKIKKNFMGSKLFYARQMWTLLNFQLWHKIFIEDEMYKKGMGSLVKFG